MLWRPSDVPYPAAIEGHGDLHVTTWGDGPRALLVHGSMSFGDLAFSEQRPLAERWQLDVLDRRGFGGSLDPLGRVDFDADARDVAGLLDDPAHLVGHSYGGVVCLLATALRPEGVRSLTVIEPPAFGLGAGIRRSRRSSSGSAATSPRAGGSRKRRSCTASCAHGASSSCLPER